VRIATRLFLYIFTLVVLAAAALGHVSVQDEKHHLIEATRSKAWILARALASVLRYYHPTDPTVDLEQILAEISPFEGPAVPSLRFYDRDGNLLSLACPKCGDPPLPHQPLDPDRVGTKGQEQVREVGTDRFLSVVQPVRSPDGTFLGAVEVILPLRHIGVILSGVTRRFLLFTSAVAALLGAVIFLINRLNISLPIRRLKEASRRLGEGDLTLRIDKTGVADLDELVDEFNRMAARLEEQSRQREEFYREKLRLERGLRHAERLASIGQLTSGLAHEIGTPLNVILGRAEQVLARLGPDDPNRSPLEAVVRQVRRITETIDRLLAFSRKSGRALGEVRLRDVAEEAFSLSRLRAKRDRAEVRLELTGSDERIRGDEAALRQMFVNLMLNSLQAMPGGGAVRVTIGQDPDGPADRLRVVYEDEGPGIPSEIQEKVFDPFFTTKGVGEGTGLGLFIVANIVDEHGGDIRVENAAGGGARFVITFSRTGPDEGATA